jgi:uncharacterized protein (DUF2235 family)
MKISDSMKNGAMMCQKLVLAYFIMSFVVGCSTNQPKIDDSGFGVENEVLKFENSRDKQKHIFVFFDGTNNTLGSKTNTALVYDYLKTIKNKNIVAIYIPGVGSLMQQPITGRLLGRGMEDRIVAGHVFLSQHFKAGDDISIFGFSRGAHQARSLAGFVSYMGLVKKNEETSQSIKSSHRLIEKLKKQPEDDEMMEIWKQWKEGDIPPLSETVRDTIGYFPISANINFLGLWDTVPGSSFKKYGTCKEEIGSIKSISAS